MKKVFFIAALVLTYQFGMSVMITAIDNHDGTCLIELNTVNGEANIVGMGLEVDCFAGEITAIDITSYNPLMNIYPDAAYSEEMGDGYQYGEGTPIANDDIPGEAWLPSSDFTISAGVLNGFGTPGADGYATIRFLLSANENVTGMIQENATRGGLVAVDGASLDMSPEQLNFTITIPEPGTIMLLGLGGFPLQRKKLKFNRTGKGSLSQNVWMPDLVRHDNSAAV